MRKIVALGIMLAIISSNLFADEKPDKSRKYYFTWQLYSHYAGKDIQLKNHFENNSLNIFNQNDLDTYLSYAVELSFLGQVYSANKELGDFLLFNYALINFFDAIGGGPEKRRQEQLKQDKEYSILHPNEPKKIRNDF